MEKGTIFWMLMILWAIFGYLGVSAEDASPYRRRFFGAWGFLSFVLFFLLGWKIFGFVVQ